MDEERIDTSIYEKAFPYMKDWRKIWAEERRGNKELGLKMREYLRTYGILPDKID